MNLRERERGRVGERMSSLAASLPFPVEELVVSFLAVCAFLPCVLLTDWLVRGVVGTVSRVTRGSPRKEA